MDLLRIMCKVDEGAYAPERAHEADAGFDLRTPCREIVLARGGVLIDTGVHFDIPMGYVGFIKTKSGLCVKHNLRSAGGVIDSGYTGSVKVKIFNDSDKPYAFGPGDKVAQIVFLPIPYVVLEPVPEEFFSGVIEPMRERGSNGFGSTGR